MAIAVYPLSADPIHNGHIYTLSAAAKSRLFEKIYFSIGPNPEKNCLFSMSERIQLAKKAVKTAGVENVIVESFEGVLRNYVVQKGAKFIIRGSRKPMDFEYEQRLSDFNNEFGLQTFVITAPNGFRDVSSTMVKAIVKSGSFVHDYVHPAVKQGLEEKIWNQTLVGVTGNMGSGKTTFCQELIEYAKKAGYDNLFHIDFDSFGKKVFEKEGPLYEQARQQMIEIFGEGIITADKIDRKKMSKIAFGNHESMQKLNSIFGIPSHVQFEEELAEYRFKKRSIVLVDAAYIVEYNMLPHVNYNCILINCDFTERIRRCKERDNLDLQHLDNKLKLQMPNGKLEEMIQAGQASMHHGFYHAVDSSKGIDYAEVLDKLAPVLRK